MNKDYYQISGSIADIIEYAGTTTDIMRKKNKWDGDDWLTVSELDSVWHSKPYAVSDDSFCVSEFSKSIIADSVAISASSRFFILKNGFLIEGCLHCGSITTAEMAREIQDDIVAWRDAILAANE